MFQRAKFLSINIEVYVIFFVFDMNYTTAIHSALQYYDVVLINNQIIVLNERVEKEAKKKEVMGGPQSFSVWHSYQSISYAIH